jgi:hypothetical protein
MLFSTNELSDVNIGPIRQTAEEEMSGLLNVALQNLRQLIRGNEFAYTKDIETIRKIYDANSNTMAKFKEQRLRHRYPFKVIVILSL